MYWVYVSWGGHNVLGVCELGGGGGTMYWAYVSWGRGGTMYWVYVSWGGGRHNVLVMMSELDYFTHHFSVFTENG